MSYDNVYSISLDSSQGELLTSNNSNVRFTLHKAISINDKQASIALKAGIIPRSFYVVNGTNDAFDIIIGATTYHINLPHGNYTAKNMSTYIASYINTAVGGTPSFTCSYSKTTNKYTLTALNTSSTISVDTVVSYSAYKLLGISKTSHLFTASGSNMVFTSDNCVNVMQINTAHIRIGNMIFSDVYDSTGHASNVLHSVYFSTNFNAWEMINENFIDWKSIASIGTSLTYLDISIQDEDGNYIDFNGVDWQMTLLLKLTTREETTTKDVLLKPWGEEEFINI